MATISLTFCALLVLLTFPVIFLFWVTESKTARANRLRAKGWTYKRIAKAIGMSKTTARNYCRVAVA
jgi:ABC-type microcin C transport system permease subunit YejE